MLASLLILWSVLGTVCLVQSIVLHFRMKTWQMILMNILCGPPGWCMLVTLFISGICYLVYGDEIYELIKDDEYDHETRIS